MVLIEAMPLILPAIICIIVYWVIIRLAPHLPKPLGRRIVIGYTALHLVGWVIMHLLVSIPFAADVRARHEQAMARIKMEIARDNSEVSKHSPEYVQHLQRRINKTPWSSVWSVSPIPFVLVSTENYQLGPLWGLGMLRVYIWTLTSMKCLSEGQAWIS